MNIICLDFESYFDREYSLDRMTTEAYVRDKRFEPHGAAIKYADCMHPVWYAADQLSVAFDRIDWPNTAVIAHHAHFDGLILNHHFNRRPKLWLDTLSMARLLIGNHLPLGLEALAKHYELAPKSVPYEMMRGKRWREMNNWERSAVAEGCKHDVELEWEIFGRLAQGFPAEEYDVVDMTVRMFTEPKLLGDKELLANIWLAEDARKKSVWSNINVDPVTLRSNVQFAALLESRGVDVVYKNGKNAPIPAVAKNDPFMQELLDDPDEEIAALAAARIDCKSSAIQTRAETLGNMASRGALCIYLYAYGAHTTRWSGGDGANFQNLKRGHEIRRCLVAPEGYLLAVPDQSQIECRILNYLARQDDMTERFRNGADPYVGIASQFYGRDITKADQSERGTGKQAELSCGYGCGAAKFQRTARLGIYGPPVLLDADQSKVFVDLYRNTHPAVVRYWREAESIIGQLANGHSGSWGPMTFSDGVIKLPNDAPLLYDTLEWHMDEETGERYWRRKTRNGWDKMYGAKLVEQTTQALARVTASQAMLRIRRAGFPVVGTSHDEAWVLVADDTHSAEAAEYCRQEMMRVPDWLPGIPLDAEIKVDRRYAK